ncbi:S9 family peptidase [Lysobacter sp. TY2-98]|uniref:alpha/beta hydrolase family protein n=1 Tax=Lysobacter sp. TY2-98 TaxID=2290922 RepID=UPI000E207A00|nr:S9 family peptidase [Lysobacter sp. TY2-98]AXK73536.1 S9 family peptidase [Lysobacter sp. TY2-98]
MKKTIAAAAMMLAMGAAHAVDIDAFIRKEKFLDIKISPTGEYLAATVPLEDRVALVIFHRSNTKLAGTFDLGRNTAVADFEWVNANRVLISAAQRFGALDEPSLTGELYGMNADGSAPEMLVGYRIREELGTLIHPKKEEDVAAFPIDPLGSDDRYAVIKVTPFDDDPYNRAERLDVYTGQRKRLASAPVRNADFMTDNAGVVRFADGFDSNLAGKLYYRAGDGAPWELLNDEDRTGHREHAIGFSGDNKIAYLQVDDDAHPARLVALDLATRERKDLFGDDVADPSLILYRHGTREPIGVVFDGGKGRTAFFDDASAEARMQRSLEAAFPASRVFVTSGTSDGRLALVRVSSDQNPGDYYLFDTTTKNASFIVSSREWVDPAAVHRVEPIAFKARDGIEIHGYLTRPSTAARSKVPMVVLPHGGPFGVYDRWDYDVERDLLASAGYAVLQVNFRGSGGYGRGFEQAGAYQWGKAMQDDLTDATRWAIDQGVADASRICLYGASYGGYASLMGVAKEPDLYRCAAGYVGIYDLPMLYSKGDINDSRSGRSYLRQWVGPENDLPDTSSPVRIAQRIKVPVFLAAGGEDRRAPIEHSKSMERALKKAGVPVETLYYDTEGHGFYTIEHQREFYTRLLAFLSKNIGGEAATPSTGGVSTAK